MNRNKNITTQIKAISLTKSKIRYFSNLICATVGVYILYNSFHDVYYVGQTLDARARFFDHSADLERNTHYSVQLQKDYNEIKSKKLDPHDYIRIELVYSQYFLKQPKSDEISKIISILKAKEKELINELRQKNKKLYNTPPGNSTNVKRPVMFKDPIKNTINYYESVAACEQDLKKYFRGLSEKEIKEFNSQDIYTSRSAIMKRCADNNKIFSYISQTEYEKAVQEILEKQVVEDNLSEQNE